VAQEALRSPPPRSHPHVDALGAYWDLVYQVLERAGGVPHAAVDGLAGSARAAGLDVAAVDGNFAIMDPEIGFDLHAGTLLAARERAVASGIAGSRSTTWSVIFVPRNTSAASGSQRRSSLT
jgi:hypothetical protein